MNYCKGLLLDWRRMLNTVSSQVLTALVLTSMSYAEMAVKKTNAVFDSQLVISDKDIVSGRVTDSGGEPLAGKTYLIAAEAYYKMNDLVNAKSRIDEVRRRAVMPGHEADLKIRFYIG